MTTPLETVLAALRNKGMDPRQHEDEWRCKCPAHTSGSTNSLSICSGSDGKALVHCFGGCETEAVAAALGLKVADLFQPDPTRNNGHPAPKRKPAPGPTYPTARAAVEALERRHGKRSAAWTYKDAEGEPVGMVLRWDTPNGKRILPVSRHGGTWAQKGMFEPRPLYRLPELLAASPESRVYVVEGEKAADAAVSIGLLATTSAHGAKAAGKADWTPLRGRDVVVLPDNDPDGDVYAGAVADLAHKAGARSVRIVKLPDLPAKGDIADITPETNAGREELRMAIQELAAAAGPVDAPEPAPAWRPFPLEVLPDPLRSFIGACASAIQTDPAMVALPVLATCAGAVGLTRVLELKPGWREPCIVWAATVARSGAVKSPSLDAALRPLRELQAEVFEAHKSEQEEYEARLAMWEAESKKNRAAGVPKPEPPACPRYLIGDATIEAVAPILSENPRGVLMARDELRAWFSFDRYKGGHARGGDAPPWLEAHRGGYWSIDRKGAPRIYVPRVGVGVLGTIQPGIFRMAVGGLEGEHAASGMLARFLLASPPEPRKRWSKAGVHAATARAYGDVVRRLAGLEFDPDGDPVPVVLTTEAEAVWAEFYEANDDHRTDAESDAEAAMLAKLEGYAARLALLVHLIREAAGEDVGDALDAASMAAGVELVNWFAGEAVRLYATFSQTEEEAERARLVQMVRRKGGRATEWGLARSGPRRFRGKPEAATAALEGLVAAGLGAWHYSPPSPEGGRPTAREFVLGGGVDTETPAGEPGTQYPVSNTQTEKRGKEEEKTSENCHVVDPIPYTKVETGTLEPSPGRGVSVSKGGGSGGETFADGSPVPEPPPGIDPVSGEAVPEDPAPYLDAQPADPLSIGLALRIVDARPEPHDWPATARAKAAALTADPWAGAGPVDDEGCSDCEPVEGGGE